MPIPFDFDNPVYEPHTVAAVKRIFADKAAWELPTVPVCYDVGANIGYYTCLFSHLGAMVLAFEPWLDVYTELLRNIREQGMCGDEHVSVFTHGFAQTLGPRRVVRGQDWELLSSVSAQATQCMFTTLDEFVELDYPPPDLMKIDVDGYESRVLEGGREVLEKHRPLIIIELAETTHEHHGQNVRDAIRILLEHRYALLHEDTLANLGADPNEIVRLYVPRGGSINVIAKPSK